MSARHWSDAWGTAAELADRIERCALRTGTIRDAASVLRGEPHGGIATLSDDLRTVAELAARRGEYEDYAALDDAADALDELPTDDGGCITGEFRAVRSTVAGGASVTEYVGEDTARYVAVDLGRSDQPPELVRVWAADPDDADDDREGWTP